jgi:large subunit ribosomal protein L15
MDLSKLRHSEGARRDRKRIGRGEGSGWGLTAGRGEKGYGSRAGSKKRSWFEGGQMPLQRRLPKFGFVNIHRKDHQIVNIESLNKITGGEVNNDVLFENGLISKKNIPVKILGNGELKNKLDVKVNAVSKSAREKIEKQGGTVTIL